MFKVQEILKTVPHVKFIGNAEQEISAVVKAQQVSEKDDYLSWCSDKNMAWIETVTRGTLIVSRNVPNEMLSCKACNYIIVDDPRLAFLRVIELFFAEEIEYTIHPSAVIHKSAKLGNKVRIGQHVVIDEHVEIGEYSVIGANTVILKNTKIGNHVTIGCNNTIGGVGFGYQKDEKGEQQLVRHLGNVVIEDKVDIGNNTTIDRAVLGSTMIRRNCKIDNLVHIAHGVDLGENSLVIANAMVAGSITVGKNVRIAPSASVLNKVVIGNDATIGMGAVVLKNVGDGEVIVGNPGKVLRKEN